jgi:hypothetical protein
MNADVVVLMIYPGNDFVSQKYEPEGPLPWVAERPEPSIVGNVAPHLDWQIVNRLRLSEIARGNGGSPDEWSIMTAIMEKPRTERAELIAQYLKKYYFPDKDVAEMKAILSRNDGSYWTLFERTKDELLAGWEPAGVVRFETGEDPVPRNEAEAEKMVDPEKVDATASWIEAVERLTKARGMKLLIAVAPMASVDTAYADFYKPWPRYFSWNIQAEAYKRRLLDKLRHEGLRPLDLGEDLNGIPDTYRLTDGHWTARGTSIVARRVAAELVKLRNDGPAEGASVSHP